MTIIFSTNVFELNFLKYECHRTCQRILFNESDIAHFDCFIGFKEILSCCRVQSSHKNKLNYVPTEIDPEEMIWLDHIHVFIFALAGISPMFLIIFQKTQRQKPLIYHFDVTTMHLNIILPITFNQCPSSMIKFVKAITSTSPTAGVSANCSESDEELLFPSMRINTCKWDRKWHLKELRLNSKLTLKGSTK